MPRLCNLLVSFFAILALGGCATRSYTYRYVPGKTAVLQNGIAIAPPSAPPDVQAAIAAGNRIAGSPYGYGRGHGRDFDTAYDCSGAASYVLQAAGKLNAPIPSNAFRRYGERGEGKWIDVYARRGHVFLAVAGLRFDTGWTRGSSGPQWTTRDRPANGYVIRHPTNL
jgi:hypothetical protein